jgi:CBS-domain-containing membrane protein
LFALLDHALELMSLVSSWDSTMGLYDEALAAQRYDLHARVRKLWCKLRIVVLCGWIRSARRPPPPPTAWEQFEAKARAYFAKFKGAGANSPARADIVAGMWTFLGVFTSILILSAINKHGLGQADDVPYVIMSGSFGALATLLFGAPASPFAQPRMVLLGHILSITLAILVDYLVIANLLPAWVSVALVPALAISGMAVAGCIHPPAAAAALIYASGNDKIKSFGWMFLFLPNLVGVIIMIIVAILVNNLSSKRKYPQFWW